jgi:hypothetical protein
MIFKRADKLRLVRMEENFRWLASASQVAGIETRTNAKLDTLAESQGKLLAALNEIRDAVYLTDIPTAREPLGAQIPISGALSERLAAIAQSQSDLAEFFIVGQKPKRGKRKAR